MPTLEQFDAYVKDLNQHDWSYEMSDDYSVWTRGRDARRVLKAKAQANPVFISSFSAYEKANIGFSTDAQVKRNAFIYDLRKTLVVTL